MVQTTIPRSQVRMDGRYIASVECGRQHSGNHRYARVRAGWYECSGCGHLRDEASIREAQAEQVAQ